MRNFVVVVSLCLLCPVLLAQNPAPTVSSISPSSGFTSGGTAVTIYGSNFLTGATVTFGTAAATNVVVMDGGTITANTPANPAGPVNVTVTNPDAQSATLTVVVSPLTNPGFESGSSGWIWNNKGSATIVTDNTQSHSGSNFLQLTSQPANLPNYGAVLGTGSSWNSQFYPVNPGDKVTFGGWISRASGDGFARWTLAITDANKANATYVSTGNGSAGVWTLLQNTYTIPAGKAFIRFYAEIYGNTVTAQANFDDAVLQQQLAVGGYTYASFPPPSLTSVSPSFGSVNGGTAVTLTGGNFQNGATVTFSGVAANNIAVVSSSSITATTPPNPPGTVNVTVTNPDGQSATVFGLISPLTNPGFESGNTGWVFNGSGSESTVTNSSQAHSGNTFAQITSPAAGYHPTLTAVVASGNGTYLPVNPGDTIAFGGWASRVSGDGTVAWVLQVSDSNKANAIYVVTASATGSAWALLQQTYRVPAGMAFVRLYCEIYKNTVAAQANFDDAILIQQLSTAPYAYDPPPSVNSISPTAGGTVGGTAVTISGANFFSGATVSLGGVAATNVSVVSASTISAVTPANGAGVVDVTITNPDGDSGTLTGGYTYSASINPPPSLASTSPALGPVSGGTSVTLSGANFMSGASVAFGSAAATNVVVVSGNTITATTPINVAGPVNVTVTNPDGQSSAAPPSPANPGFELGSTGWSFNGSGSMSIVTNAAQAHGGSNFAQLSSGTGSHPTLSAVFASGSSTYLPVNPGDFITFGGWTSRPSGDGSARWSLQVTDSNKSNPVYVTTPNVASNNWTFAQQSYMIGSTGRYARFYSEIYNNSAAAVAYFDDAVFNRTPANAVFTYVTSPVQGWVGPNSGPANSANSVNISGANFALGATVTFGGVAATSVNVVNRTTIVCTTPTGLTGAVPLVVTNPGGLTGSPTLTYTFNPPPFINSVSPVSGSLAGGTGITVSGGNFLPGAKVMLGGVSALSVSTNPGSITATTPAQGAGVVSVVVTNPDGQSVTASGAYTYQQPPPSISAISPASGSTNGGTAVIINGANFLSSPTVTFGGAAGTVTSVSATAIAVVTPATASTGAVDVTVLNSDGQFNTASGGFNYVAPSQAPTIISLSTSSGSTLGGSIITINGSNFVTGATVSFGGAQATNVSVANSSAINASTPAHAPGTVNVTVTNPDGQSATLFGAVPLLTNPGFELGAADWQSAGTGSATVQNDPANAENGNQYALLTSNAGLSAGYYATDSSGSNQYFPVVAGDLITFGGSAYRLSGDGLANYTLAVYDSSKNLLINLHTTPNNASTPVWAHMLGTYAIPGNGAFVQFSAQLYNNTATAQARFDQTILQRLPAGAGYTYVGLNSPGVFTYHYDNLRTGQNTNETTLTPANVNHNQFGKKFSYPVDGWMHGQPLYVANVTINGALHNVVYAATEHDSVYAFDADGLQTTPLWQTSFINPAAGITTVPTPDVAYNNTQPEYGIMSTPVIDPVSGTIYVLARTKENGSYFQKLHALDITTGAERPGSPATVQASVAGTGSGSSGGQVAYSSLYQNVRPALVLANGIVYFGSASVEDTGPYHGWVLGYDATTLNLVGAYNDTANGSEGGIWQSGGGIAADAAGNLYVETGNGTFDANLNGADLGDSIIKLQQSSAGLNAVDFFTPWNQSILSSQDMDVASGAALLLPDQPGPHVHELIGGGKEGTLYVLDRDAMGGYNSSGDSQIVQELQGALTKTTNTTDAGLWSTPTYWNNLVYIGGRQDVFKVFQLQNGLLTGPVFKGTTTNTFTGTVVSSNGAYNPILWLVQTNGPNVMRALNAYDVTQEYYDTAQAGTRDTPGGITKFMVPMVVNGKVYVGTQTRLDVYGLF